MMQRNRLLARLEVDMFQGRPSPVDSATHCLSCGRFVGPQNVCPHCGAQMASRLSLRMARYGALALAILGLLALWGAARAADVPAVKIQDLDGTMNWAYLKLRGTVIRPPSYDVQTGYLRFWIYDGTGEAMVAVYRNESRALIAAGRVPAMGDRVTVEGTLQVKEDLQSLIVNVPDHVIVERPAPAEAAIQDITAGRIYQKVQIWGQVRQVKRPYEGLTILTVRDETGQIDVTYAADLVHLSGEPIQVVPGDAVSVRGAVSLYGQTPQIVLDTADGLQRLPEGSEVAPERAISQIQAADIGQMVRVGGAITDVQWMSAGQKLTLDDGTGTLTLLLWQDLLDQLLNRADLIQGAWVSACGIVSEYRGALELVPELPLDVQVVQARPIQVTQLALVEIAAGHAGQTVSTEGQIVRAAPFSSGHKFTLQDGQAQLALVFWQNLLEACPARDSLVPGAWVSVRGQVTEYRDEVEIVPDRPDDVVFLKMGELPGAERRAIADMGQNDVGQVYEVEGQIAAVTPFSRGIRWTLDDGSGRIIVLVWENVIAPLSMTFDVGTRVQVTGEIQVYRGTLELVPVVPADIRWLEGGLPPTPTPGSTATALPTLTSTRAATATPTVVAPKATPRPSPTPGVQTLPTGKLGGAQVGQRAAIQGPIVEVVSFASGVKLYLDDGSGRAVLWIPQELIAQLTNAAQLIVGSTVRAAGRVDEYKGEKEVVPQAAGDVVVLVAATPSPVSVVRMADLSAADKGKTVTVEGAIVEVKPFSQGMKYILDDGSAKITLLLWQNIYDAVPGKEKLAIGIAVRATGKVDEYRGELEVIPDKGSDVVFR